MLARGRPWSLLSGELKSPRLRVLLALEVNPVSVLRKEMPLRVLPGTVSSTELDALAPGVPGVCEVAGGLICREPTVSSRIVESGSRRLKLSEMDDICARERAATGGKRKTIVQLVASSNAGS